jgi:serine/threonine protein phosphatase 1
MKKWVIGDIHGNFKALKEVLTLSGLDYEKDKLIILGDVCDGHNQTKECVDELLKIKHRVFVLGNHDMWFINYIKNMDDHPHEWIYQGGDATLESYQRSEPGTIPESHKKFFLEEPVPYHIEDNMLFIHGGMGNSDSPTFCDLDTLTWDRSMIDRAMKQKIGAWDAIYVGHTTTQGLGEYRINGKKGKPVPLQYNNVWCLDTGGGFDGKLCLMDIHTKKYWLSAKAKAFPIR